MVDAKEKEKEKRNLSFVTIIIPCRNEEHFIEKTLASIISQDYSIDKLEILVIDGISEDGTNEIVNKYAEKYPVVRLLINPKKIVPTAMNIGIRNAKGDIIIRMDAHALYPVDYISRLVYYLNETCADNVGGRWETLPANNSLKAKAIASVVSSPFGVGNAKYRLNNENIKKEYIQVDTVPFGCYPKSLFDKIGLYDEELVRNQDNELNERLISNGGKIILIPSIVVKYFARDKYLNLFRMMYQYGYFGPLVDIKVKKMTRLRKYIPSVLILSIFTPLFLSLIVGQKAVVLSAFFVLLYILTNICFSIEIAMKQKKLELTVLLLWGYICAHFGYGIGYIKGLIDLPLRKRHREFQITR